MTIQYDKLRKLVKLLRSQNEWPKHPLDGVPTFDLDTWSSVNFKTSEDGSAFPYRMDECGTTACACGLYALAYPEDGLRLRLHFKDIFDVNISDEITTYGEGKDKYTWVDRLTIGLWFEDENHKYANKHVGIEAAAAFFGITNETHVTFTVYGTYGSTDLVNYFFVSDYYPKEQRQDHLAVANRIEQWLDAHPPLDTDSPAMV